MLDTVTATKAKNNFGELIRHVYTTSKRVIVEKDGIPIVVIGPLTEPDLRKNAQDTTTLQSPRSKTEVVKQDSTA